MSSVEIKVMKSLFAGIVALAAAVPAVPALAQAVVVRSTGPSAGQYPQGRMLPAGASVTLRAGDKVTVLDKAGTRVLSGPGTFSMNGAVNRDASAGASLASLALRGPAARTRTGAVRGAPTDALATPAGPDSIWYVDVSKGGTYCIADPSQVVLWRPNRTEEGTGKFVAEDGAMTEVIWKAGNALKLWPSEALPVVDGHSYSFTSPVGPTVKIVTRVLADVPQDDLAVASALAKNGCHAQLDVLTNAAGPESGAN